MRKLPLFIARTRTAVLLTIGLAAYAVAGCGYSSAASKGHVTAATPSLNCSVNPTSVVSGVNAQIAATANSPLGLPLAYSFSSTKGSLSVEGSSATLNTHGISGRVGITCNTVDTAGNAASMTVKVEVSSPTAAPPTVSCSASPTAVTVGGTSLITAVGNSSSGSPLTYSWSTSAGTISGSGNTATLNTAGASAGTAAITCNVTDGAGQTASATTAVTINAPAPPTVSCSASPTAVTVGGTSLITAVANSPSGSPLTYSWSTNSGTISGNGNTATLNTTGASAGTATITCKVANALGQTASATTPVTINAAPPTISCSASPTAVTLGGTSLITAVANNPSGSPLTYSWSTSAGTLSANGNTATLNTTGAAAGTATITCKVANGAGQTASATTPVTINAAPPPTISCSASPTSVTQGSNSLITSVGSSPSGRPLTYSWSTSAGTISGTGSTATLNTTGATGTASIRCTVKDDLGGTASATAAVTINAPVSTPPSISCSASPATVSLGGSVGLTAIASSPEGRPLTYAWSTSAGSISGSGNTATLNTTGASAGTITVTCKVSDDQSRTASATTVVTVGAPTTPPTISCSANPATVAQGASTTITASGNSPQGLPLTYSYATTAGSISGNGTTGTLQTSGASAGMVTVSCTADQQGGGTATATTNVLVQGTTGQQALTAFQFDDSVGVNLHLGYQGTVYDTGFAQLQSSLIALGVKHFRDGVDQYSVNKDQFQHAEALGQAGIKGDWIADIHDTASVINTVYANAPDAVTSFEGPNEDDADAGTTLTNFMQLLHSTVRANPGTANMPVYAPSFTQASSFNTQGNISSLVTNGNMHDYYGNHNPETGPYGSSFYNCGGYGTLPYNICLAEMVGVGEQPVSTETGYNTSSGMPEAVSGRYMVRTLFEHLRMGVNRTFLYELVDDDSGNWGLMTNTWSPKPAYTAIKNVLALLQDENFSAPGKLDYSLAGSTTNVHQLLLQKHDGTYYLALWLGVASVDPNNPTTVYNVPPQTLTLTANTPVGPVTAYVVGDDGSIASTATELTNGSLSVSVGDRVTLLALTPGQSH